jgi:hypothetical protein
MTDTANKIATGIRGPAVEVDATRALSFYGSQRPHLVPASCFVKKTIEIRGIE